jgi:4-hydroxy-3-methylbut-2-enyl diphosphate reductase
LFDVSAFITAANIVAPADFLDMSEPVPRSAPVRGFYIFTGPPPQRRAGRSEHSSGVVVKRTLRVEKLPVGPSPAAGTAEVAIRFVHPERGLVSCPAAVLVGSGLRRAGVPVEYQDWSRAGVASGDGAARVVSFLARDGMVGGFAAAGMHEMDAVVAEVVASWSAVLRSRRLVVASPRPWCSGLVSAWRVMNQLLDAQHGRLYILGAPPPSRRMAVGLRQRGAVFVNRLDQVPPGARVMVGQAGVGLATWAEADARGLRLVDATCPVVARVAGEVRGFAEQGETVVLVADDEDAATAGLVGQAPHQVVVTGGRSPTEIHVPGAAHGRIAVVLAPGAAVARAMPVAEAVRSRFGHVIPQDLSTTCSEPSDRQAAVLRMAGDTDVTLVLGPESTDGDMLTGLVTDAGTPAYQVRAAGDIQPGWIRGTASIGITASTAADGHLVDQVIAALAGLGPTSIVEVTTHTVPFTPQADVPRFTRVCAE